jgi:hypothetical protein
MTSHRLRSISSVFGGKNSKEIAGRFCPCGSAGAAVSLVTLQLQILMALRGTSRLPPRRGAPSFGLWAGLRHRFAVPGKISEDKVSDSPSPAKRVWEIAQYAD